MKVQCSAPPSPPEDIAAAARRRSGRSEGQSGEVQRRSYADLIRAAVTRRLAGSPVSGADDSMNGASVVIQAALDAQ